MLIMTVVGSADYKVDGIAYFSDGSFGFWEGGLIVTNEGGTWKLKGNGYKSSLRLRAHTERRIAANSTVQTENGLQIEIEDVGNLGLQSAKITGSGLPSGGITLSKPANEPVWLYLDTPYQNSTLNSSHLYAMNDTTIGSIPDNSIYTVEIKDATNGIIETRTTKIAKRPFMTSELTNGHFPTSNITSHSLSATNIGGTFTFTYAKPTAFLTAWLDAGLDLWDNSGHSLWLSTDLPLNQSSGSIINAPSFTPTQADFMLEAQDEFRRDVWIGWMFQ